MLPGHWAWQRQRAQHHVGAVRDYARDDDFDMRGPNESPRGPCDRCAAAAADTSLYQSCSSTSADDDDDDDMWATAEAVASGWPQITTSDRRRRLLKGTHR